MHWHLVNKLILNKLIEQEEMIMLMVLVIFVFIVRNLFAQSVLFTQVRI